MNFDEFIARVVDEMRSRLLRQGDGSDIRVNKVLKNNGVELTAMNVCKSSEEVCPTIYLDPFYRDYEQVMDFDVVMKIYAGSERRTAGAGSLIYAMWWMRRRLWTT